MRLIVIVAIGLLCRSVTAVTDGDRVLVYHDFRTAFDARQYETALPLAEKLVSMTEEQYGSADRAFLRPLHGLGATYFATGQYEDASLILKRALDLSRNLDGLLNLEQMSILDPLIDSLVALDRRDEAERAYDYSIRVAEAAYGKADLHVLRLLGRSAHWQEKMGRYTTARILYARALQIAEQASGAGAISTVDPLEGIARMYRLEFVNGSDGSNPQAGLADPSAPELDPAFEHSQQQLNPDGERAILMALRAIDKTEPLDHMRRGGALVELGDWYMCAGLLSRGLHSYKYAWKEFELGGSTDTLAAPRQLAYRAPLSSVTRSKADRDNMEEHFVEVTFTVTKEGRTAEVATADCDATESQQKTVLSAIRKARYAPRLENGEPAGLSATTASFLASCCPAGCSGN